MGLKYWVLALISCLFLLFFSSSTQAQIRQEFGRESSKDTVSPGLIQAQNPENSYEFKFGMVEDSQPVSTDARDLNTYCHSLKDYLKNYNPILVKIEFSQRFAHHEGIAIECGPNSITSQRINDLQKGAKTQGVKGFFSAPFFRTETKIIIKNSKRHLLNQEKLSLSSFTETVPSALSFRVGVLKNTTSEEALKSIYPNAIRQEVDTRTAAINFLNQGSIDAYISDEVLLPSMLGEKVLKPSEFSIEPKLYGLTNEYYGIVLYDDPSSPYPFDDLRTAVNDWVNNEGGLKERRKLVRETNYSATSRALRLFISLNTLYNLPPFVLLLLIFLFPIVSLFLIAWLFCCIAKIPLFNMVLTWIRRRGQDNNKIAHIINVFVSGANNTLIPQYIDRNAVIALLKGVGDPLLQPSNQNMPLEAEVEQVAENLAQKAKSDPYFLKVLKALLGTLKDVTTEETDKWLRRVITKTVEKIEQNIFSNN